MHKEKGEKNQAHCNNSWVDWIFGSEDNFTLYSLTKLDEINFEFVSFFIVSHDPKWLKVFI